MIKQTNKLQSIALITMLSANLLNLLLIILEINLYHHEIYKPEIYYGILILSFISAIATTIHLILNPKNSIITYLSLIFVISTTLIMFKISLDLQLLEYISELK